MSTHDSDGIDEALQGVTHLALSTAARVGEQMARRLAQESRDAQARSEQAARESAARLQAEREAARAALAPVHHDRWWDTAAAEDVTEAYTTAMAWRDLDPLAARAAERIVEQARTRHGVDLDVRPVGLTELRAEADAREERTRAGAERAEAVELLAGADALDSYAELERERRAGAEGDQDPLEVGSGREETEEQTAREQRAQAGLAYDSAKRREALAHDIDGIENPVAVDARVRADVAQGRPATDAVAGHPGRAPKARRTKTKSQAARAAGRGAQSR